MCKIFIYKKLLAKTRSLKDLIRSVHCKEGHSHQDIDEQEGSYSWYPRVEQVKTVTGQNCNQRGLAQRLLGYSLLFEIGRTIGLSFQGRLS